MPSHQHVFSSTYTEVSPEKKEQAVRHGRSSQQVIGRLKCAALLLLACLVSMSFTACSSDAKVGFDLLVDNQSSESLALFRRAEGTEEDFVAMGNAEPGVETRFEEIPLGSWTFRFVSIPEDEGEEPDPEDTSSVVAENNVTETVGQTRSVTLQ